MVCAGDTNLEWNIDVWIINEFFFVRRHETSVDLTHSAVNSHHRLERWMNAADSKSLKETRLVIVALMSSPVANLVRGGMMDHHGVEVSGLKRRGHVVDVNKESIENQQSFAVELCR